MYKSADGGRTWTVIASSDKAGSSLPGGVKSGIVFTSELRGWMTTNAPWEGKIGLFTTTDGGYTWKETRLSVPMEFREAQLYVFPPLFISADKGFLVTRPESNKSLIYITQDGGKDWTPIADEREGKLDGISWSLSEDGVYTIAQYKTWTLDTAGSGTWSRA
ncbi:hypothetical protein GE107_15350 [Cohnella sp. CFH 77786]|uniref:WD40/YVTN/BNR-like repeat-containing protein n=1 Tax=Cohnella sp. CFH 77786 TaxID=2662265 RepID=UPI001C6089EB|nr:hypothetical protein [Cohnella sp. CFH 77786]MBW5447433.1 hypothetical protein [Cohnella sp. CFH 77786]